ARRPDDKARRPSISGICEGGATQSAGMHRRPNAGGVSPRTARKLLNDAMTPATRTCHPMPLTMLELRSYCTSTTCGVAGATLRATSVTYTRRVRLTANLTLVALL